MKNIPVFINAGLCFALMLVLVIFGLPLARVQAADETATPTPTPIATQRAQTATCDTTRTIQVSGTSLVKVVPDRVLIQLGIESNATKIDAVQDANTTATKSVMAALSAMKIEAKDISTDQYFIEPVYTSYESLNIKGYRINNRIAITLRDVTKTNDVIVAALNAGANRVSNVEFYTSELRKYRDQARDLAIKAAQEKAQALAAGLGAEAGCAIHINENTLAAYFGANQVMTQNVYQNAAPAGGNPAGGLTDDGPVSLGQISVQATVDVTFSLK